MATENQQELNQSEPLIRCGVMCDNTILPEWQAQCLRSLLKFETVVVALLIVNDSAPSMPFPISHGLSPLWRLYLRFIARPRSLLKRVDLSAVLSDPPMIKCKAMTERDNVDYFSEHDIRKIKQFDLDFILQFGFNKIRGGLLDAARYGVWSFHNDEVQRISGSPPCFWEIYNRDTGVLAVLEKLTDQVGKATTLRSGFLPAIAYSYASTVDLALFESSRWPAQVCTDIANGNTEYLDLPPSPVAESSCQAPGSLQVLLLPLKLVKNFLRRTYDHLFRHEEWNIGIIKEPASSLLKPDAHPEIHWLPGPEKGRYLADPFAILSNQQMYILCEDFDYGPLRAVISSLELSNGGSVVRKEVGIREPFHLSYPYVFNHDHTFYCVPETSQAREVRLYRAVKFPWSWEKVCTLIKDFPGVDSTVFRHDGRWWLTCTNAEDGKNYKLFVWHANELTGPWQPHPLNPVKLDVRSARPGGTPFLHYGYLYRPAQDCSTTYGGRIVVNRILQLTPVTFVEESVKIINPDRESPYRDGLHTLSAAGEFTVVDGKRHLFQLGGFTHAMRYILR